MDKKKRRSTTTSGVCCAVVMMVVVVISSVPTPAGGVSFNCSSTQHCNSIIQYVSPNLTTLSSIITLFNVSNRYTFLGVNRLDINTPLTNRVTAKQTLNIPIPCICSGGTGKSDHVPVYKVLPGDGLDHIAVDVFSRLVTFPEIQAANNISDPNKIDVGQELWIPLPCSCDDHDGLRPLPGQSVIHYGYVVPKDSTVQGIAQLFDTTQDILLKLNGLASPNDLKAESILDVPLRACNSSIRQDSLDYPLLLPNDSYTTTAENCVFCRCDAANNWMLKCDPSPVGVAPPRCPSTQQCQGSEAKHLGNTTSSGCNSSTCSYAGFNNQTIFTTTTLSTTCPASASDVLHGWRWNLIAVAFQLTLLLIHFA